MVTIGLPFFNNDSTLGDAIRSVFAQTYTDWQLVLVDDGSSDASLRIAESVRDPRVVVISDGHNLGLAARLNQIAEVAEHKYTARMDADDLMHPERLTWQIRQLENDPLLDLVDTGLLSIDELNRPRGTRCCNNVRLTARGLIAGQMPVHASLVGRTEWFRQHPYDPKFRRAQDFELWNRVQRVAPLRFKRIPWPYYFAREVGRGSYRRARETYRAKRQVVRLYGPDVIGSWSSAAEISRSYAKQFAYWSAGAAKFDRWLIDRRNEPLSPFEQGRLYSVIGAVLRTEVPGFKAESPSAHVA